MDKNVLPSFLFVKATCLVLDRPSAAFCPHDWSRSRDWSVTRLLYTNDINVCAGNDDVLQTLDSAREVQNDTIMVHYSSCGDYFL